MKHNDENIYNILLNIRENMGEVKADLKNVVVQTTKTNGMVNELEDEMIKRKEFEDTWKGRISVIGILLGLIGTLIGDWIRRHIG